MGLWGNPFLSIAISIGTMVFIEYIYGLLKALAMRILKSIMKVLHRLSTTKIVKIMIDEKNIIRMVSGTIFSEESHCSDLLEIELINIIQVEDGYGGEIPPPPPNLIDEDLDCNI